MLVAGLAQGHQFADLVHNRVFSFGCHFVSLISLFLNIEMIRPVESNRTKHSSRIRLLSQGLYSPSSLGIPRPSNRTWNWDITSPVCPLSTPLPWATWTLSPRRTNGSLYRISVHHHCGRTW